MPGIFYKSGPMHSPRTPQHFNLQGLEAKLGIRMFWRRALTKLHAQAAEGHAWSMGLLDRLTKSVSVC